VLFSNKGKSGRKRINENNEHRLSWGSILYGLLPQRGQQLLSMLYGFGPYDRTWGPS